MLSKSAALSLVIVSIFCCSLMYFNMRHLMKLNSHYDTLTSTTTTKLNESDSSNEENPNANRFSSVQSLKTTVQAITTDSLASLKEKVTNLKQILKNIFTENYILIPVEETESQMSLERINYADEMLGAKIEEVIAVPADISCRRSWFWRKFHGNLPESMLNFCMKPGCCFAFKNGSAKVTIILANVVIIDAIEIQHIPQLRSPSKETSSAPKSFRVFGIDSDNLEYLLGEFEFTKRAAFQVFPVHLEKPCGKVRIHFQSNHGNPNHTCVYRVAVYGSRSID